MGVRIAVCRRTPSRMGIMTSCNLNTGFDGACGADCWAAARIVVDAKKSRCRVRRTRMASGINRIDQDCEAQYTNPASKTETHDLNLTSCEHVLPDFIYILR